MRFSIQDLTYEELVRAQNAISGGATLHVAPGAKVEGSLKIAPEKAAPPKAAEPPKEKPKAVAPPAEAEKPKGSTRDDVRKKLQEVSSAADKGLSKADAIRILGHKDFGAAESISALKDENFARVVAECDRLLKEGAAKPAAAEADPFA